ncbi:30S ribosomal protein S8 [Candidatus Saccharibacteria bacterium]|nr:30S ribosomal protein S8 [Candidatus Saccharibacteria bacterium]MBI3338153.1 30S ribosomal protein S8 [Candidatus Saccharibacteria bacterium]
MTDPIADMLSRIRNAIAVRKNEIQLPHSKLKEAVARLLKDNGFINGVFVEDAVVGKTLRIVINSADTNSKITEIARLSSPGRRHYVGATEIPVVKRGRGMVIVSTSKGLMTGDQAKKQSIGGELICKVY